MRTFEVCLWGDEEVLRERFIARADPPLTEELRPYFDAVIRRERIPVLPASTPRIEIDTTDLTSVDQVYGQLIEKVRAHVNA